MEQRRFGNTDLVCSAIGIGTWELGTTQYGPVDIEEAIRAINVALDHGVTLVDTAEVYGPFHSEEIVAQALGTRRKDVVLVTKVGFDYNELDAISGRNSHYDHVLHRTEGCLRRLETDWIDLLLIHWPDHDTPYDEPVRAMETLKQAGKIRYYGVSNFSPAMMDAAGKGGDLATNQIGYNLIDRRVEATVLPYCRAHDIGFMAYGTLCYGILTGSLSPDTTFVDWDWRAKGSAFGLPLFQQEQLGKELRAVARLQSLAARYDKCVAQLAIAWVLSQSDVTVTLVGMRTPDEAQENLASPDWRLGAGVMTEIDAILAEEGVPTYVGHRIAM
ncbi:MAG: aldo/keto reductase [Anaerolineae bacterium]|nr:aldo/keto reductase [Anaerolineae bacterium]